MGTATAINDRTNNVVKTATKRVQKPLTRAVPILPRPIAAGPSGQNANSLIVVDSDGDSDNNPTNPPSN
ncbi:unnamed protein product [Adineta ricciae]|uniref:Uncharacterized protein n=1 Tax=Adineta ricciae TaxID=249248 RepID=A0A814S8H2_ADIRI|nr:unnamed protein product [Adineta ricciae]